MEIFKTLYSFTLPIFATLLFSYAHAGQLCAEAFTHSVVEAHLLILQQFAYEYESLKSDLDATRFKRLDPAAPGNDTNGLLAQSTVLKKVVAQFAGYLHPQSGKVTRNINRLLALLHQAASIAPGHEIQASEEITNFLNLAVGKKQFHTGQRLSESRIATIRFATSLMVAKGYAQEVFEIYPEMDPEDLLQAALEGLWSAIINQDLRMKMIVNEIQLPATEANPSPIALSTGAYKFMRTSVANAVLEISGPHHSRGSSHKRKSDHIPATYVHSVRNGYFVYMRVLKLIQKMQSMNPNQMETIEKLAQRLNLLVNVDRLETDWLQDSDFQKLTAQQMAHRYLTTAGNDKKYALTRFDELDSSFNLRRLSLEESPPDLDEQPYFDDSPYRYASLHPATRGQSWNLSELDRVTATSSTDIEGKVQEEFFVKWLHQQLTEIYGQTSLEKALSGNYTKGPIRGENRYQIERLSLERELFIVLARNGFLSEDGKQLTIKEVANLVQLSNPRIITFERRAIERISLHLIKSYGADDYNQDIISSAPRRERATDPIIIDSLP